MNYEKLKKDELIDLAKERGIDVGEEATTKDLVALLVASDETEEDAEEEVAEVVAPPSITQEVDEEEHDAVDFSQADEKMIRLLKKEPKEFVHIPLDIKEQRGSTLAVILNGVEFNIIKGKQVQVPRSLAEIVRNAQMMDLNENIEHKI